MTRSMIRPLLSGIFAVAMAAPLHAQMIAPSASEPASPPDATFAEVRTDGGVIMISDGGPFQTAVQDQRVNAQSRLMVSKESAATVVYDDGCRQKYEKPGIYQISPNCVLPVAVAGSGPPTALIVGGAVIAAYAAYEIIHNNNDDDDNPPISP